VVSCSKYLLWHAMHFLQRSTHFSKNELQTVCRKLQKDSGAGGFDLGAPFSWLEKPRNCMGARSGLYCGCSNGVPPISVSASIATFQSCNADAPLRLLRHPKKRSFKTTVTPFSRSGWSVVNRRIACQGRYFEKDSHRTSTKSRLGVIRRVHELCKRPSYFDFATLLDQ
jgi:hypothetical protein